MPVLVDTSVWVDHLRRGDQTLVGLLRRREVLAHEAVVGEVALGGVAAPVLHDLARLPAAPVASAREVMGLIERERLVGSGIGWVDAHLVASALLTGGGVLWSLDSRLARVADRLGIGVSPSAGPGGAV